MSDYTVSSILSRHYSDSIQREIYNSAKTQLGSQQIELAVMAEKFTKIQAENDVLRQKIDFFEQQYTCQNQALQQALSTLNVQKMDHFAEKTSLQDAFEAAQSEAKQTQMKLSHAEKRVKQLEIDLIRTEAETIKRLDADFKHQTEDVKHQNVKLQAELAVLHSTLKSAGSAAPKASAKFASLDEFEAANFDTLRTRYLNGDTRDRVAGFDILAARKSDEGELTANQLRRRAEELNSSTWREKTKLEWALEE
ncbi:hypothetical protein SS50377_26491 [Spironucleus salmonicida]|uniref:Uncharacterized protein n=1 Tax=Spironucleus salmonicida TaxID=348837 RepID=V6LCF2_9EUKA|nr:hypothetical protein SS50377_26491 [Spironucleus salmonicida]|eukprot:EST41346.1 Hypothetical protein SS50377_19060 [Spironucleus salmonicida]